MNKQKEYSGIRFVNMGAAQNEVKELEESVGITLQEEYVKLLMKSNGCAGEIGEYYIDFWAIDDIVMFYEDIGYDSLGNLLPFAGDGCGMAYAFYRNSLQIWMVPMDSLDEEDAKLCSADYETFIRDMYEGKLREYC